MVKKELKIDYKEIARLIHQLRETYPEDYATEDISVFCEIYGNNTRNKVLESVLEKKGTGFAIEDISNEAKVSKSKTERIIKSLTNKGILMRSRIGRKTQLYRINEENKLSKMFLRNFNECFEVQLDMMLLPKTKKLKNLAKGAVRV